MLDLSKIRYYAWSLFDVAKEAKAENKIIDELIVIESVLRSEKRLEDYFLNPEIKLEEKKESLKKILDKKISDYAYNFIFILIENKELEILNLVIERLKTLIYKEFNIVEVEIISTAELSSDIKNDILKKVEEKVGKSVKLNTIINPKLLGGMKIKIDDEMVDLSVRGKLEGLKQEIIN